MHHTASEDSFPQLKTFASAISLKFYGPISIQRDLIKHQLKKTTARFTRLVNSVFSVEKMKGVFGVKVLKHVFQTPQGLVTIKMMISSKLSAQQNVI